jgi:hypothetical protein
MSSTLARALLSAALTLAATSALAQENIRGATTGPTTAPGFSHPEQYLHLRDVKPADNMYRRRADHGGVRLLSEGAHQVSAAVQDRLHVEQSARL